MGRHGAGSSGRRSARTSIPLIAIAALVLAAIGFGIWLWTLRSVTDPIDAHPVDAYAVVVSSPGCDSGSGSTVIDLSVNPTVRTSMSACGRQAGERVAVQYLDGHPDQVRLSGTTVAHGSTLGRWLPIAILAAGLLAVGGTIALLIDRRTSRHSGAGTRVTVAQLRAGAAPTDSEPKRTAAAGQVISGSMAGALPDAPSAGARSARAGSAGPDEDNPDVTSRIASPGFPGELARPFRASEIVVEDDLFTHRVPEE